MCDYCGEVREGARRYACLTCKKSHVSCSIDKGILMSQDGIDSRGFHYNVHTSISVCPAPVVAKAEKPGPPTVTEAAPKSKMQMLLEIVFLFLCAIICYAKGRVDERDKKRMLGA